MHERESKEIITPGGHTVVLNTYITGRERRKLQFPYFKEATDFKPEVITEKGKAGAIYEETQDLALKLLVVSVDGKREGDSLGDGTTFSVIDWALDLPSGEFNFLVKAINEITSDRVFETEKKRARVSVLPTLWWRLHGTLRGSLCDLRLRTHALDVSAIHGTAFLVYQGAVSSVGSKGRS